MITHAYATVPYYRATDLLGLAPGDFASAGDLARLPLIEPAQIQGDPRLFTSTKAPLSEYLRVRSGGSTGCRAASITTRRLCSKMRRTVSGNGP